MPWALLSAHLSSMTQLYAWKHVWLRGSLTRKRWLFKIPAANSMEEPFCMSSSDHYHKTWCFLKTRISLGIFEIILGKHKPWGRPFAIAPKSSEFQFIEFCMLYLQRLLAVLFLSLWSLQLSQSPVTCHCLLLSFLLYSLCACITHHLLALPTRPSREMMLPESRAWTKGRGQNKLFYMDGLAWIQDTSSNKMSLQIAQITVNKYCLHAWCKTSTDKTNTIICCFGTCFCLLHL